MLRAESVSAFEDRKSQSFVRRDKEILGPSSFFFIVNFFRTTIQITITPLFEEKYKKAISWIAGNSFGL
jgi:hypothetical protein